jgi:hypothetical protein
MRYTREFPEDAPEGAANDVAGFARRKIEAVHRPKAEAEGRQLERHYDIVARRAL